MQAFAAAQRLLAEIGIEHDPDDALVARRPRGARGAARRARRRRGGRGARARRGRRTGAVTSVTGRSDPVECPFDPREQGFSGENRDREKCLFCGDFSSRGRACDIPVGFGAVRRGSIVQLVVIGIVSGAIATCIAVLVPWMPVDRDHAGRADRLHLLVRDGDLAVRVRRRRGGPDLLADQLPRQDPDDWSDGPPIHGHTTIEVVWTVIPTILVTAICIVSAIVLAQNSNAGNEPAQDRTWSRSSSHGSSSTTSGKTYYPILRLPIDRKVKLSSRQRRDPLVLGAAVRAEAGRRAGYRRRRS